MDFIDPFIAFALLAPILIVLGLALAFLPPFHIPGNLSALRFLKSFALIFAATALPEEILFRSLIQNWLDAEVRLDDHRPHRRFCYFRLRSPE